MTFLRVIFITRRIIGALLFDRPNNKNKENIAIPNDNNFGTFKEHSLLLTLSYLYLSFLEVVYHICINPVIIGNMALTYNLMGKCRQW